MKHGAGRSERQAIEASKSDKGEHKRQAQRKDAVSSN